MCGRVNHLFRPTFSYNRHPSSIDDEPNASFHLLLRLLPSLEPIGTVRLIDLSPTKKKLGRLCVLKEYRSFKFGQDLVLASHKAIIERAQTVGVVEELEVSLNSQLYVKGFYAK
jgi:predicted GNAT family N-acyltransferase